MNNKRTDSFIIMMDNISELLKEASKYGLQTEVVTYALKAQKENPKLSIDEAMSIGYFEWVK